MSNTQRILLSFIGLLLLVVVVWYLSNIVAYVLISAVLALIGRPLVTMLCKVKVGRFQVPSALAAIVTLAAFVLVAAGFVSLFVPLVVEQARIISGIDINEVADNLEEPLAHLEAMLSQYELTDGEEHSSEVYLREQLATVLDFTRVSDVFGGLVGAFGNIFMALFSVLFITFFFLKDRNLLTNFIFGVTPDRHLEKVKNIIRSARTTLSRYFIGIIIQVSTITTVVTIGLMIVGIENALVIGFFAGLINVIPYIGPLIGASFGIVIGLSSNLGLDFYTELVPMAGWIALVFLIVQLTDNFLLQPLIFSNSVNIHPLEVFLLILIGSSLAGIPGMILAVPSYAFMRIVAVEFLSQFKIVQVMNKAD